MTQGPHEVHKADKSALIHELEIALRDGWKIVLTCLGLGVLMAVFSLRSSIYSYPVQMQLTEVQSTGGESSSGSSLSQLSGLASLANISIPTNQNELQFQLFIDSLYTRDLANDIAKDQNVMKVLFADEWDSATQSWHEPPRGTLSDVKNALRSLLGLAPAAPWQPPGGANVQNFLYDNLSVTQDPRKEYIVTLKLTSHDKDFAIRLLNLISSTADNRLRQRALLRAQDYIAYLSGKLQSVTVAEHRAAIAGALSEQERYAMVASSNTPFAAEIFESPWASNLPSSPVPRTIFLIYALAGGALGLMISFCRQKYGKQIYAWLRSSLWIKKPPLLVRRPLDR